MDSHSRDDTDICSPHGTSVVLEMLTQNDVSDQIKYLASSLPVQDLQFELTAVSIAKWYVLNFKLEIK